MQLSTFADLTVQPFLRASFSDPADLDGSSKSILARDVRGPPRVWDNRDRFIEPTGTTRASIVGATRPPVGYYLEFPKHLVGFADSIRRLFCGSLEFGDGAIVRQVNFDTSWGTEVLKGRREVDTKPKWLERFFSTKG